MVSLIPVPVPTLQESIESALAIKARPRIDKLGVSKQIGVLEDFEFKLPGLRETHLQEVIKNHYAVLGITYLPKLEGAGALWFNGDSLIAVHTGIIEPNFKITSFEFPRFKY